MMQHDWPYSRFRRLAQVGVPVLVLAATSQALAAEYHVAPSGDDAALGSEAAPWATIARANDSLLAGDTVWLHGGTYDDPIRPANSGTGDDARIVYRVHGDGDVVLHGFSFVDGPGGGALGLGGRDFVSVIGRAPDDPDDARRLILEPPGDVGFLGGVCGSTGVVVENIRAICTPDTNCNRGFSFCVGYWNSGEESSFNVLRNSHITGASSESGNPSDYTEDIITMAAASHHNLIEDNIIEVCRHSALYADSPQSHSNVIRGNTIRNPQHTALSIWSTGVALPDGARYLVEGNVLIASAGTANPHGGPGNALQWGSDELIVRHNQISAGGGANAASSIGGLAGATSTSYGVPYFATDGRIYNNTIAGNEGMAVGMMDFGVDPIDLGRHVFLNNFVFDSQAPTIGDLLVVYWDSSIPTGDRWVRNVFGQPGQGASAPVISNAHHGSASVQEAAGWMGPDDPVFGPWNGFDNLYDADPGFVDAATGDYHLVDGSVHVDAGAPLTVVGGRDTSEGTTLLVEDARYFFAEAGGFPPWMGVDYERIRIGAQFESAVEVQLVGVDDATNTLTLAEAVTRAPGDLVWLASDSRQRPVVAGTAPDIGAFELGIEDVPPPGGNDDGADETGGGDGTGDTGSGGPGSGDGTDSGGASEDGATDARPTSGAPGADGDMGAGCGCRTTPSHPGAPTGLALLGLIAAGIGRRRS